MRRFSATTTWFVYEGVASFFWTLSFTVAAVFFVLELGLNPLELVLVGTAMELAVFVFEVPTGIVADTYGRKRSVVVGMTVIGASYLLVGISTAALGVLAAYAVWGLGWTFLSGAFDAWLADEVGEERLGGVYHRGAQVERIASLAGIGVSVGLAQVDLRLPILVGGVGTLALALLFLVAMPETGFRPQPREGRTHFAAMAATGREGVRVVRARPLLLAVLGISAFFGMWSESFDRLWEAHFLQNVGLPGIGELEPVVWFGILNAGSIVLAIALAAPLGKRLEGSGQATAARALLSLDAFLLASALVFALAGSLWLAVGAYWATRVARNVANPVFTTWLQRSVGETEARATVLSITNQADAVGQWTGGPALGVLGNAFGIRAALAAGAFCMAPALWLYARAARHEGRIEEVDPAVV
ncbi:MAG TPA: MFS transporter [Gaiellaceae bacterium]|nr:MFS transporter [Gaiellaceae bacterium]